MIRRSPSLLVPLLTCSAALLAAPHLAYPRPIQIIHTNDLHSYLEHATDPARGGFAAVKAKMDEIKARASQQGIESIVLDAGDFSEGSPFYLAAKGESVYRVMDAMGYDAVTIGNHDWLMGTRDLDRVVNNTRPRFAYLGANFLMPPAAGQNQPSVRPFHELKKAGLKIAILGVTTNEIVYRWRADGGVISDPVTEANKFLPLLRSRNDAVIALSHLGYDGDLKFAAKVPVDLVVGGHSHTELHEPSLVQARNSRQIPVVQAGEHGHFVGDLLVDIEPGKPLQVLRYRLEPVYSHGATDPLIASLVSDARKQLETDYGTDWLYETVGRSDVTLERQTEPLKTTTWSRLVADAIRESAAGDVAVDVNEFSGTSLPPGPINREHIFSMYPRVFDFADKYGWNVWTNRTRGIILRIALIQAIRSGTVLTASGITFETESKGDRTIFRNFKIAGNKLRALGKYQLAVPEGLGRGAVEITPLARAIFRETRNTSTPIWRAIEDKVRRMGGVIR